MYYAVEKITYLYIPIEIFLLWICNQSVQFNKILFI